MLAVPRARRELKLPRPLVDPLTNHLPLLLPNKEESPDLPVPRLAQNLPVLLLPKLDLLKVEALKVEAPSLPLKKLVVKVALAVKEVPRPLLNLKVLLNPRQLRNPPVSQKVVNQKVPTARLNRTQHPKPKHLLVKLHQNKHLRSSQHLNSPHQSNLHRNKAHLNKPRPSKLHPNSRHPNNPLQNSQHLNRQHPSKPLKVPPPSMKAPFKRKLLHLQKHHPLLLN